MPPGPEPGRARYCEGSHGEGGRNQTVPSGVSNFYIDN